MHEPARHANQGAMAEDGRKVNKKYRQILAEISSEFGGRRSARLLGISRHVGLCWQTHGGERRRGGTEIILRSGYDRGGVNIRAGRHEE